MTYLRSQNWQILRNSVSTLPTPRPLVLFVPGASSGPGRLVQRKAGVTPTNTLWHLVVCCVQCADWRVSRGWPARLGWRRTHPPWGAQGRLLLAGVWCLGTCGQLEAPKVRLVKVMVFPLVKYGCESWTVKKAEHRKIDAFKLWCWRRLLRVPWTARRAIQSILKEISPGCSLEAMMLKLEIPVLWPPHAKSWLIGKDSDAGRDWLGAGGEGDDRRWDGWMASPTWWTWVWVNSGRWWWTGRPGMLGVIHGVAKCRTELSDWTELNWKLV